MNQARPRRRHITSMWSRFRAAFRPGTRVVLGAIVACLVAAGCGSNSVKTRTSSSNNATQALAFAKCMRTGGVSSFPDPGTVSGPANSIGGVEIPPTINMQSPAFVSAMSSCKRLIPALSHKGPPITASMKASLIAHAQCMRTHGVPGYQDPTFPPGGGIMVTDAGTDPQSPAYRQAEAVCAKR